MIVFHQQEKENKTHTHKYTHAHCTVYCALFVLVFYMQPTEGMHIAIPIILLLFNVHIDIPMYNQLYY